MQFIVNRTRIEIRVKSMSKSPLKLYRKSVCKDGYNKLMYKTKFKMRVLLGNINQRSQIKIMKIGNLEVYGIIYKITNIINDKVYIGQTTRENGFDGRYYCKGKGIERVYKYHKNSKERFDDYNEHLLNSIEKYGFNSFEVNEIFDIAFSKEELNIKEKCWIGIYDSNIRQYGYNFTNGGDNGKRSKDSKTLQGTKIKCIDNNMDFISYIEAVKYFENIGVEISVKWIKDSLTLDYKKYKGYKPMFRIVKDYMDNKYCCNNCGKLISNKNNTDDDFLCTSCRTRCFNIPNFKIENDVKKFILNTYNNNNSETNIKNIKKNIKSIFNRDVPNCIIKDFIKYNKFLITYNTNKIEKKNTKLKKTYNKDYKVHINNVNLIDEELKEIIFKLNESIPSCSKISDKLKTEYSIVISSKIITTFLKNCYLNNEIKYNDTITSNKKERSNNVCNDNKEKILESLEEQICSLYLQGKNVSNIISKINIKGIHHQDINNILNQNNIDIRNQKYDIKNISYIGVYKNNDLVICFKFKWECRDWLVKLELAKTDYIAKNIINSTLDKDKEYQGYKFKTSDNYQYNSYVDNLENIGSEC